MGWLLELLPAWVWIAAAGGVLLAAFLTLRAFGVPLSVALTAVGGVALIRYKAAKGSMTFSDALLSVITGLAVAVMAWISGLIDMIGS